MASLPRTNTVSYEEWLTLPEVSEGIEEVVNGEIRIMPPAEWTHTQVVERLNDAIRALRDPQRVLVITANFGLIIRERPLTSRVPDLAVFEKSTIIEKDGYVHSAPQLAVEVLSPANSRKEREEKLQDYAELGVPEVWVVAPEGRTVEVLYLEDGRLRRSAILAEGTLTPRHFPEVHIEISGIWPD